MSEENSEDGRPFQEDREENWIDPDDVQEPGSIAAPGTQPASTAQVPLVDPNARRITLIYDARNPHKTFLLNAEGFDSPVMVPGAADPKTGTPLTITPMQPHPILQRTQIRQALLLAIQAIEQQEMAEVQAQMSKIAAQSHPPSRIEVPRSPGRTNRRMN